MGNKKRFQSAPTAEGNTRTLLGVGPRMRVYTNIIEQFCGKSTPLKFAFICDLRGGKFRGVYKPLLSSVSCEYEKFKGVLKTIAGKCILKQVLDYIYALFPTRPHKIVLKGGLNAS